MRQELLRDCDLLAALKRLLLICKSSYPHLYSIDRVRQLAAVERRRAVRLAQLSILRSAEARFKANFNPNQPRVPEGQREGGQWTSDGGAIGGAARLQNDAETGRRVSVSSRIRPSRPGGRAAILATSPLPQAPNANINIDYSRALTGISNIDDVTKSLSETLSRSMQDVNFLPEWTPRTYGTAVHVDFGVRVRLLDIPGVEVEQSFFKEDSAKYGDPGSIRTDIILRNEAGDIQAIYDVKTGGAVLTSTRVKEIRDHTGAGPDVPIIEMQVNRGATVKGMALHRQIIGSVTMILWNPVHRGSAGPARAA
jgi:hypothetical protein